MQDIYSDNPKRMARELKNLNKFVYDFMTRGCIRNCSFCVVPEKEGGLKLVKELTDVMANPSYASDKTLMFMDNNFLAYGGHKEILQELVDRQIYGAVLLRVWISGWLLKRVPYYLMHLIIITNIPLPLMI